MWGIISTTHAKGNRSKEGEREREKKKVKQTSSGRTLGYFQDYSLDFEGRVSLHSAPLRDFILHFSDCAPASELQTNCRAKRDFQYAALTKPVDWATCSDETAFRSIRTDIVYVAFLKLSCCHLPTTEPCQDRTSLSSFNPQIAVSEAGKAGPFISVTIETDFLFFYYYYFFTLFLKTVSLMQKKE